MTERKTHRGTRTNRRSWQALTTGLVVWALTACLAAGSVAAATPAWAEPRALNIVDVAGQVPDSVLRDAIVVSGNSGLAQFVSSQRTGSLLRITVQLSTRRTWSGTQWWTNAALLGQLPTYDHPGSAAPVTWLRLYRNSGLTQQCTSEIRWANYKETTLSLPEAGAATWDRYTALNHTLYASSGQLPIEANGMRLPANWGGSVTLFGDYATLWAVFTVQLSNPPTVTYLSSESFTFQSYIGPGDVGVFQPLMNQLRARYALRHPRFILDIPAGANYVLFLYPSMPYNAYSYDGYNVQRPTSGTLRLAPDEGMLSQDLDHAGAFPLLVAWQDADQSAGPYLSILPTVNRVTPPEYVIPTGIAYDPCFLSGNCSDAVLKSIYQATMTLTVIYLKVEPTYGQLQFVPLQVADETWSPAIADNVTATETLPLLSGLRSYRAYVPLTRSVHIPTTRPLGLFDTSTGRMVGYLP